SDVCSSDLPALRPGRNRDRAPPPRTSPRARAADRTRAGSPARLGARAGAPARAGPRPRGAPQGRGRGLGGGARARGAHGRRVFGRARAAPRAAGRSAGGSLTRVFGSEPARASGSNPESELRGRVMLSETRSVLEDLKRRTDALRGSL